MILYIKNMISNHAKILVRVALENLGFHCTSIDLGEVTLVEELTAAQQKVFNTILLTYGLELMTDSKTRIIEKIKNTVVHFIHYSEEESRVNFSHYISTELSLNYNYLSNLFSESQGMTIEKYIIMHRVERIKELLANDDLNLSQIAYKMQYSSLAHLSTQFKRTTGMTPTQFKKNKDKILTPIENLLKQRMSHFPRE